MEIIISKSINPNDYEVLIRKRGDNDYASYCPQLNFLIKGTEHEEVRNLMKNQITEHIKQVLIEEQNV